MEAPGSRGAHGAGQRGIDMGNHGAQNLTQPDLGRIRCAVSRSTLKSGYHLPRLRERSFLPER